MDADTAQKREQAYQDYMLNLMKGYYDTKRDEDGMEDLKRLMELGCFGREFSVYGIAYEDAEGVAYRVSGKVVDLHEFARYSAVYGYYPTPVLCNCQRKMAPSGYEDVAKRIMKKETAYLLREQYNAAYFAAMKALGAIPAANNACGLLEQLQNDLDGRFIRSELDLFEGLLLEALNGKRLTLQSYLKFADWLKDVRKQMENDILEKTRYEKVLSGFSYRDDAGRIKYFTDAFLQTSYEKHEEYELKGWTVTPVYVKRYWLKEMGQFAKVRKEFDEHLQDCYSEAYWSVFQQLRSLPGAVSAQAFEAQAAVVRESCSAQAYQNLCRYGRRWGAI